LVLTFPEGARTFSGQMGPMMPGAITVAQRTGVPIIPVGIEGAFQAWPRHQTLPRPGHVVVQAGPPILPAVYADMTTEQLMVELGARIARCVEEAGRKRQKVLAS
jgi:1-acyl-sn-glycerol-3-phosphate acyltransferase